MPTSLHPQAKFDPLPPDLDLHGLIDQTPNFKWVQRVSRHQIRSLGQLEFEKLIKIHVVDGGKPLVIDGWDAVLPKWLFNAKWLEQTYDKKQENVRDISAGNDIPMTTGHYLRSMEQLTNQWTPQNFRDERRQRLYLKDIDCPAEWRDFLQKTLHPNLFYLNENVTMHVSSDTTQGQQTVAHHDSYEKSDEIALAPAGDLMSSLPENMRAQNLMCYIGHEGTYTPAHREMCASLGHNIMVEASDASHGEKPGSSIWFMTESKDRDVVREYFLSMLGHDIEIEKHFAQVNAWKKAPFDVYLVNQRPGDFIVIPPLAAHQVWNSGTRTMKVAWNRTTPETLRLALHEALPKARLVCRDEQYKNKAIIYFTLEKYFDALKEMERREEATQTSFLGIGRDIVRSSPRAKQLLRDFKALFSLFAEVLMDETFAYKEKQVEMLPFDSSVTCSYCRSNIFNRFLTCKHCLRTLANGDEDAYDVCMECYAMGRSCACVSGLQWCEQWAWSFLIEKYEVWREMVIINDGFIDLHSSPPPFELLRQNTGKKSVAQICQEALLRRPWRDVSKPDYAKEPSDSDRGSTDGKSKKKIKRKEKKGSVRRCHVCCHKDYSYRVHQCSNEECAEAYCYGVLYRAFDTLPQAVLQDENWQCPKCLGICNCGHCRRAGNTNPYTPKNTSLGLDTRPIADDRSVEALVDFRVHNLSWLKAAGEEGRSKDSRRMQRLRQQAANAKAQSSIDRINTETDDHEDADGRQKEITLSTPNAISNNTNDASKMQGVGELHVASDAHSNAGALDERSEPAPGVSGRNATSHDGESSYPDPLVCSSFGIGMGYYEQDDTPDKILFDPYKLPSARAVTLDDLEVPDSVRKSIRARKRKAKRDNEDPDFTLGKSSHKKIRSSNNAHVMDNVDPALSEFSPYIVPSIPNKGQKSIEQSEENLAYASSAVTQACPSVVRYDAPHEPSLRHARPMTSYVEDDDVDVEGDDVDVGAEYDHDVDEEVNRAALALDSADRIHDTAKDGLSDGANLQPKLDIFGTTQLLQNTSIPARGIRKRGRPSRRQSQGRQPTKSHGTPVLSEELGTFPIAKRPRGRPKKGFLSSIVRSGTSENDRQISSLKDETRPNILSASRTTAITTRSLDVQSWPDHASRRKNLSVTLRSAPCATEPRDRKSGASDNNTKVTAQHGIAGGDHSQTQPSRTRGKTSDKASTVPIRQQFMSMAERCALKGKRFKLGKRQEADNLPLSENRSRRTSLRDHEPKAGVLSRMQSPGQDQQELEHQDRPSSPPGQNAASVAQTQQENFAGLGPSSKHKTVVRLSNQVPGEDEYQSFSDMSHAAPSSDDSDDSDDSDIPAKCTSVSRPAASQVGEVGERKLGQGVGRGRGAGRGRARGRGPGRARGRTAK